ncbi:MAG: DNA-3-methyladenine glycosylase [Bacteroidia bacterium]|nr:DNA-3-methyladenine glycosylase [Bacteroidia bacterium]
MKLIEIPLPQIFDWEAMKAYLSQHSLELLHPREEDWFYRWLNTGNESSLFRSTVDTQMNLIQIEVLHSSGVNNEEKIITEFVNEWWDLNRDLKSFYKIAKEDHLLAPLVEKSQGLRIGGIPDLWECAAWAIVGQQVNLSFAATLKNRLIQQFGEKIEWEGLEIWQFPSAEKIASLQPEELRPLAISQRKAEYLIGFSNMIVSGEIDKEKLRGFASAEEASQQLKKIRGIGKWSSNYILLRCLRYPDAFPLGDAALYNSVKKLLGMESKPTDDELLKLAENWEGWQAYATYHLWNA